VKRRILLVDDEPSILAVFRMLLELADYEVETASSGAEALRKLETSSFHLVITDMKMETETAGLVVINAAKVQPYRPIAVILTAYPSLGSDWLQQGADAMFIKGTAISDILRGIEDLLLSRRLGACA
jgi:CheY-like chemotaxis protein